jgi:U32 family peptidase
MSNVEIMAPVGSWDALYAAIQGGADSIYFGIGHLNMRSQSAFNFSLGDLTKVVRLCKKKNLKAYVTLNSILYDEDLPLMREYCDAVLANKVDAIIVSDLAAIEYARSIGLDVHLSTQLNICNIEAVRFFSSYSDRMVLARELSLSQIRSICRSIDEEDIRGPSGKRVQIEIFVHGALCVSISGKCAMSLSLYNRSANRGECCQPCRRRYRVIDEETQNELVIDNHYIMSPKDLCTIGCVDEIMDAGVAVLKIEGRGRSPEYVHTVVSVYREAVDAKRAGICSKEKKAIWLERLRSVYNRGFWENGYYLGKKTGEWCAVGGSQATVRKKYAGKVLRYFSKIQVAECKLESEALHLGDQILITGPTTGVIEAVVDSLHEEGKVNFANPGAIVSFPVSEKVRKNDKVFLMTQLQNPGCGGNL